eukprot:scaffold20015_cov55-Cyclotella_meneghiniana.AAC.1
MAMMFRRMSLMGVEKSTHQGRASDKTYSQLRSRFGNWARSLVWSTPGGIGKSTTGGNGGRPGSREGRLNKSTTGGTVKSTPGGS